MTKWRYDTASVEGMDTSVALAKMAVAANNFGDLGYEMIGFSVEEGVGDAGTAVEIHAIFKRPLS